MSFEGFPFQECLEKHTLDFCLDKDCEHIHTADNGQTYYCDIVFAKLEQLHPPKPEEEQKIPYCEQCNNSTAFKVRGRVTICAKCGRFASKWKYSDVEGLQEAIKSGILN